MVLLLLHFQKKCTNVHYQYCSGGSCFLGNVLGSTFLYSSNINIALGYLSAGPHTMYAVLSTTSYRAWLIESLIILQKKARNFIGFKLWNNYLTSKNVGKRRFLANH